MLRNRKFWRVVFLSLAFIMLLLLAGFGWLVWVSKVNPPIIDNKASLSWKREETSPGFYTLGNNWFRKSKSGLFELYVEGEPFNRGVVNGKLTKELVQVQEDYFNAQINRLIPSKFYLHFLKYFVGWFNRNLDKNIIEEYKDEIYGISESASEQYLYIGSNYQRILNYHAAHDIGHALQNLALVGCTSFGTWGSMSADSQLIIGRNFDFYVGDRFADNKIISFIHPTEGYRFMMVTWAGFIGVVSGMNEKGLTVTINAAKSKVPLGSATPVSLVAREILQYAQNISEALAIAKRRKMFVSESFLIGSSSDHKAVLIEKTPDSLDVYDPNQNKIICTNHFQGNALGQSASNIQQMNESASAYRYQRLSQLLAANGQNNVEKTAAILRDRKGIDNADIGLGNEKAINQLIGHHSIIFEPDKLLVWVSTAPWQLGEYVAYDLNKVFALAGMKKNQEIIDSGLNIKADSFVQTKAFAAFLEFRKYKQAIANGELVNIDSLLASNPSFYQTYLLAGDQEFRKKNWKQAMANYKIALTREIATKQEEIYIRKQVDKCSKLIGS
ncbi:MAG: C45 family autoproteolytic acyltransferase/hydrolase [Chitinophagales bacterium]